MNLRRSWILVIFAALSLCGADFQLQPDSGPEVNSVLAVCNGEPILLSDVLKESRSEEYRIYASYSGAEAGEAVKALRKETVDQLIDKKLLLDEFAAKKYQLPEEYVDSMLDEFAIAAGCRTRKELAEKIRESGMDMEQLRKEARERLICRLMINQAVGQRNYCSPKMIYDYYHAHPEEFSVPEKWALSLILVNSSRSDRAERVKAIQGQLDRDPASFDSIAKEYSDGPNATLGGDLGWIPQSQLRKEFAAALSPLEIGRIAGPLELPEGTFFLMVTDRIGGKKKTLKEAAPALQLKLEEQSREKLRKEYLKKLREKAEIRYFF